MINTSLFDIAFCKSPTFVSCICLKEKRVTFIEQSFVLDQKSNRIGCIGTVDLSKPNTILKRVERRTQIMDRKSQLTPKGTVSSCFKLAAPGTDDDTSDISDGKT